MKRESIVSIVRVHMHQRQACTLPVQSMKTHAPTQVHAYDCAARIPNVNASIQAAILLAKESVATFQVGFAAHSTLGNLQPRRGRGNRPHRGAHLQVGELDALGRNHHTITQSSPITALTTPVTISGMCSMIASSSAATTASALRARLAPQSPPPAPPPSWEAVEKPHPRHRAP